MKQKLIILACITLNVMLYAQPLAVPTALRAFKTKAGTQNLFVESVTKTDSYGNVYTAGSTINGSGDYDIFLTKVNSAGVQLWQQQIPGVTGGQDFAAGMAVTDTYVVLTGGISTSTASPECDIFTMKLSAATGSVSWTSTYNGGGNYFDAGKHVAIDGSGNIYVTGGGYNASYNTDYITLKYSPTGSQTWVSIYDYLGFDDCAIKVATSGSNLTITGAVTTATASTYKLATLTLAQSTGSLLATNIGTAVTTTSIDIGTDMAGDPASNNIVIVGNNFVSGQFNNFYVQKVSPSTLVSAFTYTWNGPSSLNDVAKAVACDASGNIFVAGFSTSSTLGRELTILKLSSSGTLQYSVTSGFNGDDEGADLIVDASGDVYVTGYRTSTAGNKDYYTAKYSSTLTKIWEVSEDGLLLNDEATNITLDSLNNVIVAGSQETSPGVLEYVAYKYVQRDVITPTDFNGEAPAETFWYYRNDGQIRDINDSLVNDVVFHTDKTNPCMYIHRNNMRFIYAHVDTVAATNDTLQGITMVYNGANESAETYALEKQDFAISYFNGTGRDFPNIHANAKLITPDIYPNIDLMYSSNEHGMKYYYIVKPGGNIRDIQIEFTGATSYSLDGTSNALSVNTDLGSMTFDRPTAYQLTSGNATVAVTGWTPDWQTNGAANKYKFNDGVYTSSLTLVIQVDQGNTHFSPVTNGNLLWNSMAGGNSEDYNIDLKLDRFGNFYTLAYTISANYYMSNTFANTPPINGTESTLMMKFNKHGVRTRQVYIGSNGSTSAVGLTIVNDSNIVIVGRNAGSNLSGPTSGSNPVGALTTTVGPSYIMKIDSTCSKILWRTRYPGNITDIDSKTNGDIYLSAVSYTSSALVVPKTGALNFTPTYAYNAMVSKFNKNGVPLWSSFIGVVPYGGTHLKVDTTANEFYVTGIPNNGLQDFTAYNNYHTHLQSTPTNTVYFDAYIKKFNSADSMVVSTLVGGNRADELWDAAILTNGDVCFVGGTYSTDTAALYNPHDGSYYSKTSEYPNSKGWVLKFSPNFTRKWATLYGDTLKNTILKTATTDNQVSNLIIGGRTSGLTVVNPGGCYTKTNDPTAFDGAFLAFGNTNHVTWATSMGADGWQEDGIAGIAFNPKNNNIVFAGGSAANTLYPWEPFTAVSGVYNQMYNYSPGKSEGTVGRFDATYVISVRELTKGLVENNEFVLYPNPSKGIVNLYFKQGLKDGVKIAVCNAIGQVMETKDYNNGIDEHVTLQFNTNGYAEGLYFINISTEKGSQSIKFINFK